MDGIKVDEGGSGEQYKHELSPDRQQLKGAGDIDRQSRGCRGEYIGVAGVGGSTPCRALFPLIRWRPAAPKGTLLASTQMSPKAQSAFHKIHPPLRFPLQPAMLPSWHLDLHKKHSTGPPIHEGVGEHSRKFLRMCMSAQMALKTKGAVPS